MPRISKMLGINDAARVREFYTSLPLANQPTRVSVGETLSYELVEGSYPRSVERVLEEARDAMWHTDGGYLPIDKDAYELYIRKLIDKLDRTWIAERALACIRSSELTPVVQCHGDLTLSNCIHTYDDRIVFIDPGHHRGLPCRELDEAKILQSLDGFDMLRYGHPVPLHTTPEWIRPVHWAILLTHYIRLIPHMKKRGREDLVKFALKRIDELDMLL